MTPLLNGPWLEPISESIINNSEESTNMDPPSSVSSAPGSSMGNIKVPGTYIQGSGVYL